MNCAQAFAIYEGVRARPPAVVRRGACTPAPDLDAIADHFDTFLLDAFGVLNIGDGAIAGVPERVAGLQKAGKRVLVVSNAAGFPHAMLMEKYGRLGYDFDPDDVITSRHATLAALQAAPPMRWGLMATRGLGHRDLDAYDTTYLEEDAAAYDAAEAFLLLGSAKWTPARQALLVQSLLHAPRPVYVGNPDIVAPRDVGFSTEPGHYAHALADATGITPHFCGKPFGNIFDLAFARLATQGARPHDPARTLMVGDSLHTDILGGQAAGIRTALIAGYGFFAGQDAPAAIVQSGIHPDYILARP